ncbi:hypothetical protein MHYP_G00239500 [Metynnis hypsauchen]
MPTKPERIQLQQKREINSTKANILTLSLSSSNNRRNFIKANIHLLPCKLSNSSKIISSKINSQSSMKHHRFPKYVLHTWAAVREVEFDSTGRVNRFVEKNLIKGTDSPPPCRGQHKLQRAVSLFDPRANRGGRAATRAGPLDLERLPVRQRGCSERLNPESAAAAAGKAS